MSKRHFTSDLHLGHAFVAGDRGFASPAEHDEAVFDGWRSTVAKRDVVFVLGDIILSDLDANLERIASLPGAKHLILGNHDAAHPRHRNAYRHQRRYLSAFDSVSTTMSLRISGRTVALSHYPYSGDHTGTEDRDMQWRLRDEGLPLIHGHVHDEWAINGRQFNVGIDHHPKPASEEQIIDWLSALD